MFLFFEGKCLGNGSRNTYLETSVNLSSLLCLRHKGVPNLLKCQLDPLSERVLAFVSIDLLMFSATPFLSLV